MVAQRLIFLLAMLAPLAVAAQNYSVDDTITEYPNKGTYYHNKFEGRKTSNGEIFNQNLFTAAHWKIKLGTYVMVTNQNTGLQVIVRVNDRCPKRGVFDMSHRAANSIGIKGCQPVTVRILPPGQGYEERWAAQDAMFDSVYSKFGPNGTPSVTQPQPSKEKTESKPAPKTTPLPALTAPPQQAQQFNLMLGTASSHGEAFSKIQNLPTHYQEKTYLDTTDATALRIILDARLNKKSAQELGRALKHTFPECKVIPYD